MMISLSKKLFFTRYGLMGCALLGVVACSSGNVVTQNVITDSVRNTTDALNPFSGSYSPYGGTSKPTSVKIGRSYKIKGKRYQPRFEPEYNVVGEASWYGPKFHGRKTANGERYNQYAMTAAHKTLPLPSMVRVTRTDTGESVVLRVNDRGPFAHGRVIDVSKKAAQKLNMIGSGVAPVRVEYLPEETLAYLRKHKIKIPDYMKEYDEQVASYASNQISELPQDYTPSEPNIATTPEPEPEPAPKPAAKPAAKPAFNLTPSFEAGSNGGASFQLSFNNDNLLASTDAPEAPQYRVQTASFISRVNAERHAKKMERIARTHITPFTRHDDTYYRVSLAPVQAYEKAVMLMDQTKAMGIDDARIVVE